MASPHPVPLYSTNQYNVDIFDIIEKETSVLTWFHIMSTRLPTLPNLNWAWIATPIWNLVGRHVSETMLGRMKTLAQGEEVNGERRAMASPVFRILGRLDRDERE